MENPELELELDRIAKRLAVWLRGMNLEDPAARRFILESFYQVMATVRRARPADETDTISPYALDQAVATVQPTRSEFETDMISPSVSGLEGRVTILEDQVSRLFEKLNTAAGILI